MRTDTRKQQLGRPARFLPPAAVVEEFGLSARFLKFLRQTRRLPFIRAGHRSVLFDREDLAAYFTAHRVPAASEGGGK